MSAYAKDDHKIGRIRFRADSPYHGLENSWFIRYAQFHGEYRAYTHFLPHDVVQDAHITA
jgi:hypothetical protein